MSRKNKHIKSIVVGHKPFKLEPGEHIYSEAGLYLITGRPRSASTPSIKVLPVVFIEALGEPGTGAFGEVPYKWKEGKPCELFLGDEGAPGYAYDNRPCKMARSWLGAKAASVAYRVWLSERKAARGLDLWNLWNF